MGASALGRDHDVRELPSMNPVSAPILSRHNVTIFGEGSVPMMFAHGFGCDQKMWRFVAPAFQRDHKIVLFDYLGHGRSDARAYDPSRYTSLDGYATDVLEICDALDIQHGIFIGHSVSAMIGALACAREPERFDRLVMIGPSPRYINDGDYVGDFTGADIDELLEALESNYLGWSPAMAPGIMGRPDRPEFGEELANSFCRTDPAIARQFAKTTFLGDNRQDLARVPTRGRVGPATGESVDRVTPLVRARGAEVGVRSVPIRGFHQHSRCGICASIRN
jgi:sigma-B regulation protein RsbQ